MSEKREFSLLVWQKTPEFKEEYERATQRFQGTSTRLYTRGFKCTYIGSLRFDNNGYPEIWINSNMPLCADRLCKSSGDAGELALRHGSVGWWGLDELEQFADGHGSILQDAMWGLGFRASKRCQANWARTTTEERKQGNPLRRMRWHQKNDKSYSGQQEAESARLKSMLVVPNKHAGLDRTFILSVGKRGLIFVYLDFNPFSAVRAEDIGWLGAMMNSRGHIAKQQAGFSIEAQNVKLGGEEEGIYIKATRTDETYTECVWPTQIPNERLYDLADDLVSRVGSKS